MGAGPNRPEPQKSLHWARGVCFVVLCVPSFSWLWVWGGWAGGVEQNTNRKGDQPIGSGWLTQRRRLNKKSRRPEFVRFGWWLAGLGTESSARKLLQRSKPTLAKLREEVVEGAGVW